MEKKIKEEILAEWLPIRDELEENAARYTSVKELDQAMKLMVEDNITEGFIEQSQVRHNWPKNKNQWTPKMWRRIHNEMASHLETKNPEYQKLKEIREFKKDPSAVEEKYLVPIFKEKTNFDEIESLDDNDHSLQVWQLVQSDLIRFLESRDYVDDFETYEKAQNNWSSDLDFDQGVSYKPNTDIEDGINQFLANPVSLIEAAILHEYLDFEFYASEYYSLVTDDYASLTSKGERPVYAEVVDAWWIWWPDLVIAKAEESGSQWVWDLIASSKGGAELLARAKQNLESEQKLLPAFEKDLTSFYSEARKMKRHFILHAGPTNSGKSYDSIQALKKAEKGVYLGPLRLLAYEVYERLNQDGVPASLLTGEEYIPTEGAAIVCSTCEMTSLEEHYQIAVIDEAQMIADPDRGGAWTAAVLGLQADEIHLCCSLEAVDLLQKLISSCQDTVEVIWHERMTPLQSAGTIEAYEPGDALIVFGRKKVHALASQLSKDGWKVSILYGNLPYQVRHNEARKFSQHETEILVTTDAIGMGMNLPIRRVIFEETEKFDGSTVRNLLPSEFQQIAGRAGRFGIYDTGYYGYWGRNQLVEKGVNGKVAPLTKAAAGFPVSLKNLDAKPIDLLKAWEKAELDPVYEKESVSFLHKKIRSLMKITEDSSLIWDFALMTFDESSDSLFQQWREMAVKHLHEMPVEMPVSKESVDSTNRLADLETMFKKLDLYYQYARKFLMEKDAQEVMKRKEQVSMRMMKLMESRNFEVRRCSECGKVLRWNYPYNICSGCYKARRRSYSEWYDDWDDYDGFMS